MTFRVRLVLLIAAVLAACSSVVGAAATESSAVNPRPDHAVEPATVRRDSVRVFVSGHSLTDQPLPTYLAQVATSLGAPIEWNRQYMVGSAIKHRTRGRDRQDGWAGYSMGANREGEGMNVIEELRRRPYDVLIITEQHGVIDSLVWHDTLRYLRHFHERFVEGNPRGRTYFFEPWLGIPGKSEVRRWIAYERAASPLWQCLATRINTSLAAERRSDRIAPLPAGVALAELVERATQRGGVQGITAPSERETLDRLFHDNVHLTPLGSYYIALVAYATVFERSPLGAWAPDGVSQTQAAALQRVAGEAVARHRAEHRPLTLDQCRAVLNGPFKNLYFNHVRDDYWAKQDASMRMTWRRLKQTYKTHWRLWRDDLFGYDASSDAGFWLPPP